MDIHSLFNARRLAVALVGASLVTFAATGPGRAQDPEAPAESLAQLQQLPSFRPLVQKVMPAVVNISATERADAAGGDTDEEAMSPFPDIPEGSPLDEWMHRFFEGPNGQGGGGGSGGNNHGAQPHTGQRTSLGSGFIIDPSGYVVTNNHVVGNSEKVTVIFQDDTKHPAHIVGRDSKVDVALLKIDTKEPLPFVKFGNSDALQVGDWVVAVGNPFGLGGTVTNGIISARGRDLRSGPFDDFLQIDASINMGNSGGPTFNLAGEVVGINTAIYSPNGGSVGIGFAIPSNLAKSVIDQLRTSGKVVRGFLGVQIQEVTPDIAASLGMDSANPHGALVAEVTPGSPAAKAGIKSGDVIVRFNDQNIAKLHDLPRAVADVAPGKPATVAVWRKGSETTLAVTVAELPKDVKSASASDEDSDEDAAPQAQPSAFGVEFGRLTPELRHQYHIDKDVKGVLVTRVADDSPAAEVGLVRGDVVMTINQEPVSTPAEAAAKLKQSLGSPEKRVLLLVNHRGSQQFVPLTVDKSDKSGGAPG